MSGHSKWTQIKHQKTATDKKRSKLFSILSKRISIASRHGKDPGLNPGLKLAIDKAKEANMPGDTIERAVKRGAGELPGQGQIEEVIYEAYGPAGVQLLIVTSTDNHNRTTSNLRHLITKIGGSISGSGSVMWNFGRNADAGFTAKTVQTINSDQQAVLDQLIELLEDDEDVENIYTNV